MVGSVEGYRAWELCVKTLRIEKELAATHETLSVSSADRDSAPK